MIESIAFVSDIHANLPALEAVLADIESQGIRELLCLGDVVGYGAQPAECIELLRARGFLSILQGNHDAYAASEDDPPNVSPETLEGIRWTRARLSPEHRAWLGALPLSWQGGDCEAVHASLPQPQNWDYILDASAAAWHFRHQQKRICFIGHSHRPAMFVEGENRALDITSLESIRPDRKQVINVGSVGLIKMGKQGTQLKLKHKHAALLAKLFTHFKVGSKKDEPTRADETKLHALRHPKSAKKAPAKKTKKKPAKKK